ncbi:phage exclusion protein Lit family protein [Paracoccaceae bacterium Fryx2]|nr:phage exclusion protein Lit family protein [Paracoccaceae bacterium Fryx2]
MTTSYISDAEKLMRPFGDHVAETPSYLAPERLPELQSILGDPPWELVFLDTATNLKAIPATGAEDPKLAASYWALLSLWATAKYAVLIGDAVAVTLLSGETTLSSAPGSAYDTALKYLQLARDLTKNRHHPFPANLAVPNASPTAAEDLRVNNLFYGAVGWVLLHEIGHIHLSHEVDTTADLKKQQEYEADLWATKWILAGNGISPQHYQFRLFVVSTALLWVGQMNVVKGPSNTHPEAVDRIDRCRRLMEARDDQEGLELAAYVLKVAFLPRLQIGEFGTAAQAFDEVLYNYTRLA